MNNRLRRIFVAIACASLLLGACELPVTHRYHEIFAFENPPGPGNMPIGNYLDISLAVYVPFPPDYRPYYGPGGSPILNGVKFFANGLETGSATIISSDGMASAGTTTGELFHALYRWTPSSTGLYYLQAQAILMLGGPVNGDYSDAVEICVYGPGFSITDCWSATEPPVVGSPVPLSAPFSVATLTPTAELTATPASARDCPSGTFFAAQTHKCIPVQIVTAKPGHGSGCSQYGDASGCTSNGCSWDKPSSTCH